MKLFLKIIGIVLGLLILALAAAYVHLDMTWKKNYASFPEPAVKAGTDSIAVARGEYLANAVVHCSACHQTMSGGMEKRNGTDLNLDYGGGHVWDVPLFGTFVAANLTSDKESGIGAMSDGAIARAVRHGIARNGDLAGFMSFAVGPMADEDLSAVLAYLRTLKPVKTSHPPEKMGLFAKLVMKKLDPAKKEPIPKWVPEDSVPSVARGEYLANGPAMCFGCHSVADPMNGFAIVGPRFQGGGQADPDMVEPAFEIIPPNLTPDEATGHIVKWTEEDFLKRFRGGIAFKGSPMPWENYARMTDADVKSLYMYLKGLAPVKHETGPSRRAKGSFKPAKA